MSAPLKEEREYFKEQQGEWQKLHPAKFVLVKGRKLVNAFDKADDALAEGFKQFGSEPFLVRSLNQSTQESIFIPALAFGILSHVNAA